MMENPLAENQTPITQVVSPTEEHDHDGRNSRKISYNNLDDLPTAGSFNLVETGDITGDVTISNLTGDTAKLYKLVIRSYNAFSTFDCALRLNGETGTNYRYSRHVLANEGGGGDTTSGSTSTSATYIKFNRYSQNHLFITAIIDAVQGNTRFVNFQTSGYEDTSNYETTIGWGHYTDGSAELTSITIYHLGSTNPSGGKYWLYSLN